MRATLALLGPAFVAAIAYVDPGNFATNIAGGAKYGYLLLWVILAANLMAMLIQNLSAKVGIATGKNLPELCREHFPRPVSCGLWVQAELIAMATDLAEFVGAAIALNLLFGVPLFAAGLITARGRLRRSSALQTARLPPLRAGDRRAARRDPARLPLRHAADRLRRRRASPQRLRPGFAGTDSILLATGILGATVMPHVIYLHSALTQDRIDAARRRASGARSLRFGALDVLIAHGHRRPGQHVDADRRRVAVPRHGLGRRHDRGRPRRASRTCVGAGAALAFALALLASGFASSSVGTYAGQVVMQGFIAPHDPARCCAGW